MESGNRSGVRAAARTRADLRACRITVTKPAATMASSPPMGVHPDLGTSMPSGGGVHPIGLLIMAGLAFATILPAGRLPDYKPGEFSADPPPLQLDLAVGQEA